MFFLKFKVVKSKLVYRMLCTSSVFELRLVEDGNRNRSRSLCEHGKEYEPSKMCGPR
jgi:hypothetical protein